MEYIYKLLDEKAREDLLQNGRIQFSRPRKFKSERAGALKIFETFEDYVEKNGEKNLLDKTPSKKDLENAYLWLQSYFCSLPEYERKYQEEYYSSWPKEVRDIRPLESTVFSDIRLLTTLYFQSYCAYFTTIDLFDAEKRNAYIEKNRNLSNNKVGYVRIPITINYLNKIDWACDEKVYEFAVMENVNSAQIKSKITAQMHHEEVVYTGKRKADEVFSRFNTFDERKINAFFKYINPNYLEQSEVRYKIRLSGNTAGQSIIAFDDIVSKVRNPRSYQEFIFNYLLSVYYQSLAYPENVYIKLSNFDCENI